MPPDDAPQELFDDNAPISRLLGFEGGRSGGGVGSVSMLVGPQHLQNAGNVHGGLIAAMADTAFFRAVRSLLGPGEGTATVEMKVNFLAPAQSGRLTATAAVLSNDGRLMIVKAAVASEDGTVVAQALGTYLVMRPR